MVAPFLPTVSSSLFTTQDSSETLQVCAAAFFNEFFLSFICIGVLLTYICVPCAYLLPSEFGKGHEIPLECETVLSHHHEVLGTNTLQGQQLLLTAEPSLQHQLDRFLKTTAKTTACLSLHCIANCSLMSRCGVVF